MKMSIKFNESDSAWSAVGFNHLKPEIESVSVTAKERGRDGVMCVTIQK